MASSRSDEAPRAPQQPRTPGQYVLTCGAWPPSPCIHLYREALHGVGVGMLGQAAPSSAPCGDFLSSAPYLPSQAEERKLSSPSQWRTDTFRPQEMGAYHVRACLPPLAAATRFLFLKQPYPAPRLLRHLPWLSMASPVKINSSACQACLLLLPLSTLNFSHLDLSLRPAPTAPPPLSLPRLLPLLRNFLIFTLSKPFSLLKARLKSCLLRELLPDLSGANNLGPPEGPSVGVFLCLCLNSHLQHVEHGLGS